MPTIQEKIAACSDCAGYEAFVEDIKRCENAASMCGLCQIRAEHWLQLIAELPLEKLRDYVEKYIKGLLDPFAGYNL